MSNLMITLDDAVSVTKRLILDFFGVDELVPEDHAYIRNELEQKCYIPVVGGDPRNRLVGLIMDVNPAEIAEQIQSDRLREWCKTVQVNMQMELMQL